MQTQKQYKKRLNELKIEIENELSTIAIYDKKTGDWEVRVDDVVSNDSDANEVADYTEEADERIATLAELETRFRNIERALAKIETETFGICEIGGEKIEEERLQTNPAARTCMAHLEEEYDLPLS